MLDGFLCFLDLSMQAKGKPEFMITRSEKKNCLRVLSTLEKIKRAMNSEDKEDHRRSPKNSKDDAKNSLSESEVLFTRKG